MQGVLDAIPSEWRVSKEDLECYPAGSDIRPLAGKCGILTARELEITDTSKDATDLLQELASASISAEEAVTAFSKRAAVAHQAVTCLAGFYYEDARKRAVELDDILKKTGKPVGPLHGTFCCVVNKTLYKAHSLIPFDLQVYPLASRCALSHLRYDLMVHRLIISLYRATIESKAKSLLPVSRPPKSPQARLISSRF